MKLIEKAVELLKEAENLRIAIDKGNLANNKLLNLIQALQEYEPLYITDTAYDSLCVLDALLRQKESGKSSKTLNEVYEIVATENSYSYKTAAQRAMMMEMLLHENKSDNVFTDCVLKGNEINWRFLQFF